MINSLSTLQINLNVEALPRSPHQLTILPFYTFRTLHENIYIDILCLDQSIIRNTCGYGLEGNSILNKLAGKCRKLKANASTEPPFN